MRNIQPHIDCKKGDIARIVFLVGNPSRIDLICSLLDDYKEIAEKREFRTITGKYQGAPLSIVSTGIGCPSTAIAVEELIRCGAEVLIRIGTCGSAWCKKITPLSVVIPTACVRDEGTTIEYMPQGFPAVADIDLVQALASSANSLNIKFYKGINRTHDAFYSPDQSIVKWGQIYKDERFKNISSPIISSEMECSALFIISTLLGKRAGAVLAVDGDPTPFKEMSLRKKYLPNKVYKSKKISIEAQKNAIKVALNSLKTIKPVT